MARPKDIETRAQIEQAAFALFRRAGYKATSYSAIAEACGTTKALVQYYYKKKDDLAIGLMARILDDTITKLGYGDSQSSDKQKAAELVEIGSSYFEELLGPSGYTLFLQDVLSSRELTETVLAFNARWAITYLGRKPEQLSLESSDSVVLSMGGFYELLYHVLKEGRSIKISEHLQRVVDEFMTSLVTA